MLTHPTYDRLVALGLTGMAKALEEQRKQPDIAALSFEERLALMVDREAIERENKRLVSRLKFASLRQSAVVEDVDMKAPRGLDKALFAEARRRRLDRTAPELADLRPDRHRQKLACLCARPQGVPRRPLRPLSSCAKAIRCPGTRTRRRASCEARQEPGARRAADPGRLGPRHADARAGSRHP